jgi:hypothetical protein
MTNLAVLRKTRRAPEAGDIFVMQPPDGQFLFGRIVDPRAEIGPIKPCVMVYVYRTRASEKIPVPMLSCKELLVPPILTNKLPWSRGYFEFVEQRPMRQGERLTQHCFVDSSGRYFDERSTRITGPVEPVGTWGLDSYRTIDDKISKALGIPLAPD